MGVGGGFWDLLKPIAKNENLDYLRGKKVAIDLSYWVVQHQTALKGNARKPHLRLTFFRTINLFAKLGVFPVFVVDGDPPALKSEVRLRRFYRMSGVDLSSMPKDESSSNPARNPVFNQNIEECVELLELLGMPVLRAEHEAEALCAQLDREGCVDACITADSDAFLYGAKCIIKLFQADYKEPIVECYRASDIDNVLRLKRKHLIALALLIGCDYNLHGVPGIGPSNAVRIVQLFQEDEILNRLRELGKGNMSSLSDMENFGIENLESEVLGDVRLKRNPHCSYCGHPGNKGFHFKYGCEPCKVIYGEETCVQKVRGFKCECVNCKQEQRKKERNKCLDWQTKVCAKIAETKDFPNEEIINMFLCHETSSLSDHGNFMKSLSWQAPQMELLEGFLFHHLYWNPSYIRQKLFPLYSLSFLREMALTKAGLHALEKNQFLCGRYTLHSIHRIKVQYTHSFYVLKWKHTNSELGEDDWLGLKAKMSPLQKRKFSKERSLLGGLDEDVNTIEVESDKGCLFITTDEDMELVRAACPELVQKFHQEKVVNERNKALTKRKKVNSTSTGKQLSITTYYKATKGLVKSNNRETILPVESKEEERCNEMFHSAVPLEKSVSVLNTPLAMLNYGDSIDMDPVLQVGKSECISIPATSNEGKVKIIEIESENEMNQKFITEAVRRCLFKSEATSGLRKDN